MDDKIRKGVEECFEELLVDYFKGGKIKDVIKRHCTEVIGEFLTTGPDKEYESYGGGMGGYMVTTVKGKLSELITSVAKESLREVCLEEAERLVGGEVFLEGIVIRLNKKQLS